ncbi:hypothetical protein [Thalassobium sp. R2A62]|uniref:hypothetical protein n=1 Tax=Thalassobium sp. R2A62 TaxID=633131 RepID=UPI0001B1CB46|nr:hypothetical protein [Thalassobium sp. R2A62]EET47370.1 hypothetical protein TR2A62_1571 [Thalassobium sp. R2A62]
MKYTTTALALILAAGAVNAQDVTYLSYGLSYTSYSDEDFGVLNDTNIVGEIEYRLNQFMFMADADLNRLGLDDGTDATFNEIHLGVGYEVAPGALVWANFGQFEFFDTTFNPAEVGAQYDAGAYALALAYRTPGIEGEELSAFELVGTYGINASTSVGLSVLRNDEANTQTAALFADYSAGALDVGVALGSLDSGVGSALTALNADVTYEFGGNFRALGGLSFANGDGLDATALRIGAGYQVAENTWLDASYQTFSLDDFSLDDDVTFDGIGVMLKFEMGDRTLITRRASAARSDIFDGLGSNFALTAGLADYGLF